MPYSFDSRADFLFIAGGFSEAFDRYGTFRMPSGDTPIGEWKSRLVLFFLPRDKLGSTTINWHVVGPPLFHLYQKNGQQIPIYKNGSLKVSQQRGDPFVGSVKQVARKPIPIV